MHPLNIYNVSMLSLLFGFLLLKGAEFASVLVGSNKGVVLVDANRSAVVVPRQSPVYGLDYHYARGDFYYCQDGCIYRQSLNFSSSTQPEEVVRQAGLYINSVAVDWIHDVLYWTIGVNGLVFKANLDNVIPNLTITRRDIDLDLILGQQSKLVYLDEIVVDPFSEKIFVLAKHIWIKFISDFNKIVRPADESWHCVIRADLNGENMIKILQTDLRTASSISLDVQSKRIYAAGIQSGQNFGFIISTNYEGKDVKTHFRKEYILVNPIHVAGTQFYSIMRDVSGTMAGPSLLYQNMIDNVTTAGYLIQSFDDLRLYKTTHPDQNLIYVVKGVTVSAQLTQEEYQFTHCRLRGCFYQCVILPTAGASCICQRGERLARDGKTCKSQAIDVVEILVADNKGISILTVNRNPSMQITKTPLVLQNATAVARDYFLNFLFFFSPEDAAIYWTSLAEEGELKKIAIANEVSALAVDNWHASLYWAEGAAVFKSNLAGSLKEVIISAPTNTSRFVDIQVASFNNYLFMIVEINNVGKLMRSALSGEGTILRQNKNPIKCMAVDTANEVIYFMTVEDSDAYLSVIDYDFIDSRKWPTDLKMAYRHNLQTMRWLDVYDGWLFLASTFLDNTTLVTREPLVTLVTVPLLDFHVELQGLRQLKVLAPWRQFAPEDQQCVARGCSHICRRSAPGTPVHCVCPGPAYRLMYDQLTCFFNPGDRLFEEKRGITAPRSPVVFPPLSTTPYPATTATAEEESGYDYTLYFLLGALLLVAALITAFYLWRKYGLQVGRYRYEYQRNWWRSNTPVPPRAVVVDERLRPIGQRRSTIRRNR